MNITNSTIAGNRAGSQGGGIYNFGNNGAGTVNLNNSIVADNIAPAGNGPDISNFFGNVSGNNNIIEDNGQHTITGSNNSNVDPLLEKNSGAALILKDNGGPTKTLLPLRASPAINAGSNAALPVDSLDLDNDGNFTEPLPVDQRAVGFARIVNTTVDIGAVEVRYLYLLLDTSGPAPDQLVALDSLLLIRDPFRVQNTATWFTSEQNTRVILFALNLQLNSGESPSVVKIMLVDGNGGTHEVAAEDVQSIAATTFTQVTFRLPDALAPGTCLVSIKAHERISNSGTFRIAP